GRRAGGAVRGGIAALAAAGRRAGAGSDPDRAVDRLSLAGLDRAGLPLLPVGRAAARGRAAGDPDRAVAMVVAPAHRAGAAAPRAMAVALAPVPAHGVLGGGEAGERRSGVAQPQRAHLPLSDPAAAAVDRLVRA